MQIAYASKARFKNNICYDYCGDFIIVICFEMWKVKWNHRSPAITLAIR